MKKLIFWTLMITALLSTYTICANADEYDTIKVGLFYGDTAKESVTITTVSGVSYGIYTEEGYVESGTLPATEFTVSAYSGGELAIDGMQIVYTQDSNLSVMPLDGNIKVDSKEYRGGLILSNASDTTMNIVNVLPLEQYLYGVVGGEMPSSWSMEALKAQAICARGFAVSNYDKHKSLGFNVCATTNCQVYGGVKAEYPSVTQAVNETAGQLLMYEDRIAETLFYSSSGGHTANVENIWGSKIPYLMGVPDTYEAEDSPRHTWSATLSLEEITQIMADNNYDVGDVISLSAKTDETGRAYELTVTGTNGTHTLKRQSTYSPFYSSGVLSQRYTLIPQGEASQNFFAFSKATPAYISGNKVISSGGNIEEAPSSFCMLSSSGKTIRETGNVTGYTFSGGGWGHGVGMSQYGAKGMAEAGFSCADILYHYYPGTQLQPLKGNDPIENE